MEFIKQLSAQGFTVFNVSEQKRPVNANGFNMSNWESITAEEARAQHNYNSTLWGIRCGRHGNGRVIMSLDFDCCGQKDASGKRMGCQYTKDKLSQYLEFGVSDGLFSSSTAGNMNVLVDYTNCPTLIELVESQKLSKFKQTKTDLEILLGSGHQQVIPPSQTTCKITGTLGDARKFIGGSPILILSETMPLFPFILSLLQKKEEDKKTVVKKNNNIMKILPEVPKPAAEVLDFEDQYLDLLFNVIKNETLESGEKLIDWDTWFQIGGIMKSNGYDVELFIKYSEAISDRKSSLELWNGIKKLTMSIHGLRTIAKKMNPEGYRSWSKKHNQFISATTLSKGENDVAKHIAPQLKDKLKYSAKMWYYFDEKTRLWESTPEPPFSLVITHLQNEIAYSRSVCEAKFAQELEKANSSEQRKTLEEKREAEIEIYEASYRAVTGSKFSSQMLKILKDDLKEKDFVEMLDNNPYEVAYKNGILDLATLKFRHGLKPTDYLTKTIPFDYEEAKKEDVLKVREELKKICNYNEQHLDYYLSILGYSLTGDASRKQEFYYLRGQKASNGKSVVFENLTEIIPNYVGKIQNDIFDKKNTTRHKSIEEWGGLRVAWTNELTTDKKDAEFIKEISDGTSVKFKKMYGTEQKMPITFKPFIVSNHTIVIDADAGVKRRTRILQMDSDFVDSLEADDYVKCRFKKDDTFGLSLRTTYKHAFLHLLFSYAKKFVDNNFQLCDYPREWAEESEETMKSNNKFLEWFEDSFEIFNGGENEDDFKINKNKFEMKLKTFGGKINFKDEVKKNRWNFTYDSQKKFEGCKGVWYGFRILENDMEE